MVKFVDRVSTVLDSLPEGAQAYAEWYVTPVTQREPLSRKDWEEENDVPRTTINSWMGSPWWPALISSLSGSRLGLSLLHDLEVTDALFRKAVSGDTKAIDSYFKIRGITGSEAHSEDAADLSDDELAERRASKKIDTGTG